MKTTLQLKFVAFAFFLVSPTFISFCQSAIEIKPIYNPSTITLKITSAGDILSNGKTIEKHNTDIQIEAFADGDYDKALLFIPAFNLDLVRNGKLITSKSIGQNAQIGDLLQMAQDGDLLNFRAQEVYLDKGANKLELFSNGTIWFYFEFVSSRKLVLN